jgi:5'-3' exonuclease
MNKNQVSSLHVDHLFFDYNSMIHPCAQQAIGLIDPLETDVATIDAAVIKNCITYTRYVIDLIKPGHAHIIIDGVAPRAKINQQRERRYKSQFFRPIYDSVTKKEDRNVFWDSNKITPGTNFMKTLRVQLDQFAHDMCDVCPISMSDSNECGEGEHKMMHYISSNLTSSDTICIYGLDADLIMLSLLNNVGKVYLLRDNTFNSKLKECDRTYSFLDIDKLKDAIIAEVNAYSQGCISKNGLHRDNIIADFIFLCFLLGNDFLEHLPSLIIKENGIDVILKKYVVALEQYGYKPLIDLARIRDNIAESVNIDILIFILEQLSQIEGYFFSHVYSVYKKNRSVYRDIYKLDELQSICRGKVNFYLDDYIRYNEKGFKNRHYVYYGIENVEEACKEYLEGLYWILGYYFKHAHSNWTWFYRHNGTPFVSDLFYYLRRNKHSFLSQIKDSGLLKPTRPNSVTEQLMMVLPRDSLLSIMKEVDRAAHDKLARMFNTESHDLERCYPRHICVDIANKEYIWQSKVFFGTFDKDLLRIIL